MSNSSVPPSGPGLNSLVSQFEFWAQSLQTNLTQQHAQDLYNGMLRNFNAIVRIWDGRAAVPQGESDPLRERIVTYSRDLTELGQRWQFQAGDVQGTINRFTQNLPQGWNAAAPGAAQPGIGRAWPPVMHPAPAVQARVAQQAQAFVQAGPAQLVAPPPSQYAGKALIDLQLAFLDESAKLTGSVLQNPAQANQILATMKEIVSHMKGTDKDLYGDMLKADETKVQQALPQAAVPARPGPQLLQAQQMMGQAPVHVLPGMQPNMRNVQGLDDGGSFQPQLPPQQQMQPAPYQPVFTPPQSRQQAMPQQLHPSVYPLQQGGQQPPQHQPAYPGIQRPPQPQRGAPQQPLQQQQQPLHQPQYPGVQPRQPQQLQPQPAPWSAQQHQQAGHFQQQQGYPQQQPQPQQPAIQPAQPAQSVQLGAFPTQAAQQLYEFFIGQGRAIMANGSTGPTLQEALAVRSCHRPRDTEQWEAPSVSNGINKHAPVADATTVQYLHTVSHFDTLYFHSLIKRLETWGIYYNGVSFETNSKQQVYHEFFNPDNQLVEANRRFMTRIIESLTLFGFNPPVQPASTVVDDLVLFLQWAADQYVTEMQQPISQEVAKALGIWANKAATRSNV